MPFTALATRPASASRRSCSVAAAGIFSAARTIALAWSSSIPPSANAARVAWYFSFSRFMKYSPPAINRCVEPVSFAAHAGVPVAASSSASWRRSDSASTCSFNAQTIDSSRARSANATGSSSRSSDPTGTAAAASISSTATATCPATTGVRSWVTDMPTASDHPPTVFENGLDHSRTTDAHRGRSPAPLHHPATTTTCNPSPLRPRRAAIKGGCTSDWSPGRPTGAGRPYRRAHH